MFNIYRTASFLIFKKTGITELLADAIKYLYFLTGLISLYSIPFSDTLHIEFHSLYFSTQYFIGRSLVHRNISEFFVHPELLEGEGFHGNYSRPDFILIGWQTKRLGTHAYNRNGVLIPESKNLFPVFVQTEELKKCPAKYGGWT